MKLGAIIIMNVFTREQEGRYLQKTIELSAKKYNIPVYISMDDGTLGVWKNYRRCLSMPIPSGTHRMVIQDDLVFDRNVLEKVLAIIDKAPQDKILAFYAPTNKDYNECYKAGRHVMASDSNFWIQCCVYPETVIKDFLPFADMIKSDKVKNDDDRLAAYLQFREVEMYAILPSLTQHLGAFRSNFGTAGIINGIARYSSSYDNQLDVDSVDWEEEFKHPFKAKHRVNKLRLIDNIEEMRKVL